jgi:protein-L-isoaspartate(D-aspartate) O-methyltransferase
MKNISRKWIILGILILVVISIIAIQLRVPSYFFRKNISDEFSEKRNSMVDQQIANRGIKDHAVLEAMRTVPRHKFVLEEYLDQAYADHPLPIGYGQTISQPYIVALMTEMLQVKPGQRVLEIGTGSGYQAAILAELGAEVYTVEIIPELAKQAQDRLERLGYTNIKILNADGYYGWEEYAPYDAIIVTAAPDHLPQPLVNQLKEGGRLVIPIGPVGTVQTLWLFEKSQGELLATNLGLVRFVPLTGEH